MKFKIKKREHPSKQQYHEKDLAIAMNFAGSVYKELPNLVKAIVLFGSTARHKDTERSDVDMLLIIDDVHIELTPELLETYKIIVNKKMNDVSQRLHLVTLKLTTFWEYILAGDPVIINVLRDGVALIDSGFFDPLQALLYRGRIRPTQESISTYFARAPLTLNNSRWHLLQATIDLYWSAIDAAHAALMSQGLIPPSPAHVPEMIERELVHQKKLEEKYVKIMQMLYTVMKGITHREIVAVTGADYDIYRRQTEEFVNRMKSLVKHP